jgi:hypothetical protein
LKNFRTFIKIVSLKVRKFGRFRVTGIQEPKMQPIISCIENLRVKLERHRKDDLKEYPTRTIFIDPMLKALGWDVRDPNEVELEFPTIDGKFVDYAPKINRKPVLFIEAKPLNDPLTDVKSITQIVGYAANSGVEWCVLTNGVTYKVYHSTEKAAAPDKILFEVSIDPKEAEGVLIGYVAEQFARFSRDSMAKGLLDEIGEQVFVTGKIRKVLDRLFIEPPNTLIRLIRSTVGDETIKPKQVRDALKRLWAQTPETDISSIDYVDAEKPTDEITTKKRKEYNEEYHIKGKPQEITELYRTIDKFCRDLDPIKVEKAYRAKTINYSFSKSIFCCVSVMKSGLRVWLKLEYSDIYNPPEYVRNVSDIGHWGVGNVEIAVDSIEKFQRTKPFIQQSFEENLPIH